MLICEQPPEVERLSRSQVITTRSLLQCERAPGLRFQLSSQLLATVLRWRCSAQQFQCYSCLFATIVLRFTPSCYYRLTLSAFSVHSSQLLAAVLRWRCSVAPIVACLQRSQLPAALSRECLRYLCVDPSSMAWIEGCGVRRWSPRRYDGDDCREFSTVRRVAVPRQR